MTKYIRPTDEVLEWAVFFKKLGVSDDVAITKVTYKADDLNDISKALASNISYASATECNYWPTPWGTRTYYMIKESITINIKFTPLLSLSNNDFKLASFVWNKILSKSISLSPKDDYLCGSTGYGWTKTTELSSNKYLGMNFLSWALQRYDLLPANNGSFYKVQNIFEQTKENYNLLGNYVPLLNITSTIDPSWREYLKFKTDIDLNTCLEVLSKISVEDDERKIKENYERVSRIYQHICDNFDMKEKSVCQQLSEWGKENKILSQDKTFLLPSSLMLVSDDLGKLEIENQIYKGKHIESRNNKFVAFVQALGVRFVNNFKVEYGESSKENTEFKNTISRKISLIALLAAGTDCSEQVYKETVFKLTDLINSIKFISESKIYFVYGEQRISQKAYANRSEFHYVGNLGIANIELLHHDIAKYLTITAGKAALMAVLQMSNNEEIRDYLDAKGYNVSFVPENEIAEIIEIPTNNGQSGIVSISISDTPYSGLSKSQMNDVLIEAKNAVRIRMEREGYIFTKGICENDYGNIYGVTKDGIDYPLVVHSYKSDIRTFQLTAFDWEQLAKPNSILWINTHNGVKCIPFYALAKDRGKINITFDATNFEIADRSIALAQVLRYYKGLHFDFGTMLPECSSNIELFNKPEKPIREALGAKSDDIIL